MSVEGRFKIAHIDGFPDLSIWAVFGHMQNFDRHIAVIQLYTWVFGLMEAKRGINFVVFCISDMFIVSEPDLPSSFPYIN